ncbi:hypothetical protein LCGC14_0512280 [marine sediment metagenome]|uniref:Uncharacterized protein n=1 Tax=marine sediment metagenome TaxID=412755 RepID=A0A0F9UMH1_9ZZZZ
MRATSRLDKLWKRYETQVYEYCKNQFDEYIKPYCIKHDLEFTTGNGTWWLGKEKGNELREGIPERLLLYNILTEPIPGMLSNDVGSLMPDYRRSD